MSSVKILRFKKDPYMITKVIPALFRLNDEGGVDKQTVLIFAEKDLTSITKRSILAKPDTAIFEIPKNNQFTFNPLSWVKNSKEFALFIQKIIIDCNIAPYIKDTESFFAITKRLYKVVKKEYGTSGTLIDMLTLISIDEAEFLKQYINQEFCKNKESVFINSIMDIKSILQFILDPKQPLLAYLTPTSNLPDLDDLLKSTNVIFINNRHLGNQEEVFNNIFKLKLIDIYKKETKELYSVNEVMQEDLRFMASAVKELKNMNVDLTIDKKI